MFISKKKKLQRQRERDIREEMEEKIVQDALDRERKPNKKKFDKKTQSEEAEIKEEETNEDSPE